MGPRIKERPLEPPSRRCLMDCEGFHDEPEDCPGEVPFDDVDDQIERHKMIERFVDDKEHLEGDNEDE